MTSQLPRTLFVILALVSESAFAETSVERELNRLRDEHQKAIAVAVEPINRRSQEALEKLLRQAMQANDLDGAVKVRAELQKLEVPAVPTATQPTTANLPVTVTEDILVQRPWVFAMGSQGVNTLTFSRNKTWKSTKGFKGTWTLKEKILRLDNRPSYWGEFSLSGEATKEGIRLTEANSNSGKREGVTLTQAGN